MPNPSHFMVAYFLSALFNCMLAYEIGKSIFPSPGCAKIAPIAKFDASTCTWNIKSQRGACKIGAVLKACFSFWKDSLHSSVQMNTTISP